MSGVEAKYYSTSGGRLPVLDYIHGLDQRSERGECFEIIDGLEKGAVRWGRGADVDALGGGLYELRPGRHRLLFCIVKSMAVLLHAVPKKGRVLRKPDILLARKRMKEVHDACS